MRKLDDGKRAPKKSDLFPKYKNTIDSCPFKDQYVLLTGKRNLMKKKEVLEQWTLDNKAYNNDNDNDNDNDDSLQKEIDDKDNEKKEMKKTQTTIDNTDGLSSISNTSYYPTQDKENDNKSVGKSVDSNIITDNTIVVSHLCFKLKKRKYMLNEIQNPHDNTIETNKIPLSFSNNQYSLHS